MSSIHRATAALSGFSAAKNSQPSTATATKDVVIIGGGLSGLQAAQKLQEQGHTYALVEANPRVGGRIISTAVNDQGGVVDLGAAWINDTTQEHIHGLVKKYGLHTETQYTQGVESWTNANGRHATCIYGEFPPREDGSPAGTVGFIGMLNDLVSKLNPADPYSGEFAAQLDATTLEQFLAGISQDPEVVGGCQLLCGSLLGCDPSEISTLFFLDYLRSGTGIVNLTSEIKDGAQNLRVREGNSHIVEALAKELDPSSIHLASPVESIDQSNPGHCVVKVAGGKVFHCKKVILTIPTPQWNKIVFNPPLPQAKQHFSDNALMGEWAKEIFVFDKPWWRGAGHMGALHWENGFAQVARDTSTPDQASITCFITGLKGREWSRRSANERRAATWEQVRSTFARFVDEVPKPINVIEQDWLKEPWFYGGPCAFVGPNVLSVSGKDAFTPWENLHFAGTETSTIWRGYMDGALRSGIRSAEEVDLALKSSY